MVVAIAESSTVAAGLAAVVAVFLADHDLTMTTTMTITITITM
jgi:hypothetical protein